MGGEVDATSSIQLDDAIALHLAQNINNLVLDLSGLNYISSAGLGAILSYIKSYQDLGRQLVILQLSPRVESIFKALGMEEIIPILDRMEEVEELFSSQNK